MATTTLDPANLKPTDHYPIISADCHAGASHAVYREYLAKEYLDDFDAWRNQYKNPYKDLRANDDRIRNWDNEKRNGDQERDHVVGEVIFPNTVPPFFPSFVLFAPQPTPETYEHRLAGIRAHNRWLVDWCGEFPERRAGIGQIFLNDIDDAIDDVRWIKEHGLRGGILLPTLAPDVTWMPPITDRVYDPLWEVCADLGVVVNSHSGTGSPTYGKRPGRRAAADERDPLLFAAPARAPAAVGCVRTAPEAPVLPHRVGWRLGRADARAARQPDRDGSRAARAARCATPPTTCRSRCRPPTCSTRAVTWGRAWRARPTSPRARSWASGRSCGGATTRTTRARTRTRSSASATRSTTSTRRRRYAMLTGNAAKLYDFDVEKLVPLANEVGPTVAEVQTPLDDESLAKIPRRI